jgi:hypothetical protein
MDFIFERIYLLISIYFLFTLKIIYIKILKNLKMEKNGIQYLQNRLLGIFVVICICIQSTQGLKCMQLINGALFYLNDIDNSKR